MFWGETQEIYLNKKTEVNFAKIVHESQRY